MLRDASRAESFFNKMENQSGWRPRAGKPIKRRSAGDLQWKWSLDMHCIIDAMSAQTSARLLLFCNNPKPPEFASGREFLQAERAAPQTERANGIFLDRINKINKILSRTEKYLIQKPKNPRCPC
jgi:hypothetical protein